MIPSETFDLDILVVPKLAKSCLVGLDILNNHTKFKPMLDGFTKQMAAMPIDADTLKATSPDTFQVDSKDPAVQVDQQLSAIISQDAEPIALPT